MANNYIDLPVEGGSSGVTSINSATGTVVLDAGVGISITTAGSDITIINDVYDVSNHFSLIEDFSTAYYSGSGEIFGDHAWDTVQTGGPSITGEGLTIPSTNTHPGVIEITVTATSDGGGISSGLFGSTPTMGLATGNGALSVEALVCINTLSDNTNNATVAVGVSDSPAWSASADQFILYYELEVSPNWILSTIKGGVQTLLITSTPVVQGWNHVMVVANAAGTSVSGYVWQSGNPVLVGTNASNVPTTNLPPMISFRKTLGSAAMYLGIDYLKIDKAFTVPR